MTEAPTRRPASPSASSSTGAPAQRATSRICSRRWSSRARTARSLKLARGGEARYLLSVDAIISVDPGAKVKAGDVHCPYPDRKRQDARHHRRSAAGGGAVRSAASEGSAIIAEIRGTVRFGKRLQEQAAHHASSRHDKDDEPSRISDPEGQAHSPSGRRLHREGRVHRRRQSGAARHPGDQGRGGACCLPRQRDPGGLPAAGRGDQRQAHRGDRSPDAAEGRDRPMPAKRTCCRASSSTGSSSTRSTKASRPMAGSRRPARRSCSASPRPRCRPARSSRRLRSRRPRASSPKPRSTARSIRSRASRRTSSSAG